MQILQNCRRLAFLRRGLMMAPVLILPIAITGVAVRPALDRREAMFEEHRLRDLLAHCSDRERSLRDFGPLEQVQIFAALRQALHDQVPAELEPIEIYNHLRQAAMTYGVELGSIRMMDATDTGLTIGSEAIVSQDVSLTGTATATELCHFVAGLEARGLPCAVTYLNLSRDRRDQDRFRIDLELGLFHYAPAGSSSQGSSPDSGDSVPGE